MNFEAYLISKKIDSQAFRKAEQALWEAWNKEFEQVHPNSFTSQKLYLINPVRRKYPLKEVVVADPVSTESSPSSISAAAPRIAKPVMRPKPKIG